MPSFYISETVKIVIPVKNENTKGSGSLIEDVKRLFPSVRPTGGAAANGLAEAPLSPEQADAVRSAAAFLSGPERQALLSILTQFASPV